MSRDIKTIWPTASISEARNAMRMSGVRHLLVLDGRWVAGVVSDRDLGVRVAAKGARTEGLTVNDVMTSSVVTASPEATIRQAANQLRGQLIGCLVVMEGAKPLGIVTTTDLLDLLGRGAERPVERTTRRTLSARGPRGARPGLRHARRG